jgi:2'-5' RNA ligase
MRAFLAVTLDATAKKRLAGVQQNVRDAIEHDVPDARISWVKPDAMHLTVAFFGAISPVQAGRLQTALTSLLPALHSAQLPIARVGAFPSLREPRTIWAGPPEDWHSSSDGLAVRDLGGAVRRACAEIGIEHDAKPLRLHLTLGRLRTEERQVGRVLSSPAFGRDFDAVVVSIGGVTFLESELLPGGPLHSQRWTVGLS